ncbi:MAG: right-handed parallel beta-helix repeat-containing protein [Candidatus Eisenbacteria bacterium]|nr:right-handed parallel beta-helix repeat-containing protein [Candidatus Eisenbacteria bacterium]
MKLSTALVALAIILVASVSADAGTWRIKPDGTGDAPTIQAGIDLAAPGDIVLLADGVYEGDGNRNIDYHGKPITVRSESGDPSTCVISVNGAGTGFLFYSGEGAGSVLKEVTIQDGLLTWGGGILCQNSSPSIVGCAFYRNMANAGGAIFCMGSAPTVTGCTFIGNWAQLAGAIFFAGPSPAVSTVTGCTFSENHSDAGGAIHCEGIALTLEKTVIAFGSAEGISCGSGGSAALTCCDVFGNAGGDWVGCIADQNNINGNFSADPMFCRRTYGDVCVNYVSPCAPGYHPYGYDCGVIGSHGVGCDHPTNAFPKTWGAIKAMYK